MSGNTTIEPVAEIAAAETAPSKVCVVCVRHVTCPEAPDVVAAKAANATSAKTSDVGSAKASQVAAAKTAAHVAAAKAATATTAMSSTATTAGLCTRGNKAAGKHRARQNHHRSSSHDILR